MCFVAEAKENRVWPGQTAVAPRACVACSRLPTASCTANSPPVQLLLAPWTSGCCLGAAWPAHCSQFCQQLVLAWSVMPIFGAAALQGGVNSMLNIILCIVHELEA